MPPDRSDGPRQRTAADEAEAGTGAGADEAGAGADEARPGRFPRRAPGSPADGQCTAADAVQG